MQPLHPFPQRFRLTLSLLVFVVIASFAATARGQGRVGTSPAGGIAVIDLKFILEKHIRFQQDRERLRQEFKATGERMEAERNAINNLEERLKDYPLGSADYSRLDEEITRRKAEWTVQANKHRKDAQNRETQLLWNIYAEIRTETKRFAEAHGISIVIQQNGEPIDNNRPQEVLKGISRPLVYVNRNVDITIPILEVLNRGPSDVIGTPQGPPGRPGVPPPRR